MNKSDNAYVGSGIARYKPYGGYLTTPTATALDRGYTGHDRTAADDALGLIYMNARYYDPYLNRFISADTIVPDPANPQSLNRYSYVFNNPVNLVDPSGHSPTGPIIPPTYYLREFFSDISLEQLTSIIDSEIYAPFTSLLPGALGRAFKFAINVEDYGVVDLSHATGSWDVTQIIFSQIDAAIAAGRSAIAVGWQGFERAYNISLDAITGEESKVAMAYGIFRDWMEGFEESQTASFGGLSSFAIEDLSSNHIGFFAYAYHREMGKGASIAHTIFELAQGGSVDVVGSVPNPFSPKNHQWNFVDCGPLAGCSAIPWPSSLTITPMAAGENTWSRR